MTSQGTGYVFGLHLWSVLTAVAAVPLLLAGGTVTTMRWGMVDDAWPTSPWYLLVHWSEAAARGIAYLAEHGHRQLAWLVGGMTIVLAGWTWLTAGQRSGRAQNWLALLCLLGVGGQGILGGLRVRLEVPIGREMAFGHGILGQVVFALLVALALSLSRGWLEGQTVTASARNKLLRLAYLTFGLVLGQLIIGVWLRQLGGRTSWPIGVHLFLAAAVLFHAVLLYVRSQTMEAEAYRWVRWPGLVVAVLAGVQVFLGMAAWVLGAGDGGVSREISPERALVATAHMLTGALLLAATLVCAVRIAHHLRDAVPQTVVCQAVAGGDPS